MPPPFTKPGLASGRRAASNEDASSTPRPIGPPDRLESLYRSEAPRLTAFFERRLRERQDVSDFVQESFARLAGLAKFDRLTRPAAYLQRIATNLLAEHGRRRRVAPHAEWDPDANAEIATAAEQSFQMEADQLLVAYRRALDELPSRTREIFLLHRMEDLPYREIAARIGISIPTVQYHVARALTHIDAVLRA